MIPLSFIPENIETEDVVLYGGWSSDVYPVEVNYRAGDPFPVSETINIRVRDIFGTALEDSNAESYSLNVNVLALTPVISFITVSQVIPIIENNTFLPITFNYNQEEIDSLPYGSNLNALFFTVNKNFANGTSQTITTFSVPVFLNKFQANEVAFFPKDLSFKYRLGSSVHPPAKEVQIYALGNSLWRIWLPHSFAILESEDSNVTIGVNSSGFYYAIGTGPATVSVSLNFSMTPSPSPISNFPILFDNSGYINTSDVFIPTNTVEGNIEFRKYTVDDENSVVADPTGLSFSAIRYTEEAEPAELMVIASEALDVTMPLWLEKEIITNEGGVILYKITPLNSENIGVGFYQGSIWFLKPNSTGASVTVTYNVTEHINTIELDEYNFTLDEKFVEYSSVRDNVFLDCKIDVQVYDFYSNVPKPFSFLLKVPIFKTKAKFNIGKFIDRAMTTLSANFQQGRQYRYATAFLNIIERDFNTNEAFSQIQSEELKYIAGRTPNNSNSSFFILEQKVLKERITPDSVMIVNFVNHNSSEIELYKNETKVYPTSSLFADFISLGVNSFKIKASDFDIKQGDILRFKIKSTAATSGEEFRMEAQKDFVCFPKGDYSHIIMWEDKYKLHRCYEFTGVLRIEGESQDSVFNKMVDMVEVAEKLSTKKNSKIFIDTGWITADNAEIISDITTAKKAWIVDKNLKPLMSLIPKAQKQTLWDSERTLVGFMVEFDINSKYNEENHSL